MANLENLRGDLKLREAWPKIEHNDRALNADIASLDQRIDNIISQAGDSNTEIVDARQPVSGSAFPVLKDRLDATDAQMADVVWTNGQLQQLDTLRKYCTKLIHSPFFYGYTARQIAMIGDSHGWGQGSPNYEGATLGHSIHTPWIHNKGFFDRLRLFLIDKYDSQPWRFIFDYDGDNTTVRNGNVNAIQYENQAMYTATPRITKGKYKLFDVTVANGFFAGAKERADTYFQTEYQYNAEIGFFSSGMAMLGEVDFEVLMDLKKPTRFLYICMIGDTTYGARAKIELLDNSMGKPKATGGYGNAFYGTETPSIVAVTGLTNYVVNSDNIIIDTSASNVREVYIIDFKQKKMGTVRISYGGVSEGISAAPDFSTAVVELKGVIANNGDSVKNISMGGHTVGAWLGDEPSVWGETRNHIADVINLYESTPPNALIIQAPIVNEYLANTKLEDLKSRLTRVAISFGHDNILIFPTIGAKSKEFPSQVPNAAGLTYEDYFNCVKEWSDESGDNITYFDFRNYLKDMITRGIIAIDDCYSDDLHPSAMVNELLYDQLRIICQVKF